MFWSDIDDFRLQELCNHKPILLVKDFLQGWNNLCDFIGLDHMWSFFSDVSLVLLFYLVSLQGPHQRNLLKNLLKDYNRMERPVGNDSHPLTVFFTLSLIQIMDVVCAYELLLIGFSLFMLPVLISLNCQAILVHHYVLLILIPLCSWKQSFMSLVRQ